jgi:hypothetical protein
MRMRASLVGAAPVPSMRVPPLTNIVWASACGPAPARVTAATAASVFSGVVFLRAIGLITLFSWVHLGHTLSRPPLPPHFVGSCDAGYRPIILLELECNTYLARSAVKYLKSTFGTSGPECLSVDPDEEDAEEVGFDPRPKQSCVCRRRGVEDNRNALIMRSTASGLLTGSGHGARIPRQNRTSVLRGVVVRCPFKR